MRLSASIFVSDNPLEYAKEICKHNIDFLHLDYLLDHNGVLSEEKLDEYSHLNVPLDVHLIGSDFNSICIDMMNRLSVNILSVQIENLKNVAHSIEVASSFNGDFGIAISPYTNWSILKPFKYLISHILVTCSVPGVSGAKFLKQSYYYIEEIKSVFPRTDVYVDGGISYDIYKKLYKNVSLIVMGSFLYRNRENMDHTIKIFKMEG